MYAPSRTADPPGTMRTPAPGGEALQRQRVLVVERPAAVIHRRVDRIAEPEPEQDALLHPRIDAPSDRTGRIGLRGAHGTHSTAPREGAQTSRAPRRDRPRRRPLPVFECRLEARTSCERGLVEEIEILQHLEDLLFRLGARRDQRQPVHLFEQAHRRHGGLDRPRTRLDEVDLHQRHDAL